MRLFPRRFVRNAVTVSFSDGRRPLHLIPGDSLVLTVPGPVRLGVAAERRRREEAERQRDFWMKHAAAAETKLAAARRVLGYDENYA